MLDIIVIGKMRDDELDAKQCKKLRSVVYKKMKLSTDGLLHFDTTCHDINAFVRTEFDGTKSN